MYVRFFSKLSLLISILALPQFITSTSAPQSFLCSSVLAADTKELGKEGDNGDEGAKGDNGRNGDNLTVFADGSPMTLDLTGGDGMPGEAGAKGEDASCEQQSKEVGKNLRGADGGHGGDGGDGGVGGNGGSLTVYTTNQEHLKQIYVIAAGGEGGVPGKGGEGGVGCQCESPYWNEETCSGKPGSPDYKCSTQEFQCADGYSGKKGRSARKGREGKVGNLTLINLDKSLAPDAPQVTMPIRELKTRGFTLSRNIWKSKDNASSLFAPGSIIADKYKELVARHEHSVLMVWDAPQPVEEYGDQEITLSLQGENKAGVSLPEDTWLETQTIQRDKLTELFVFNAVRTKDVDKLSIEDISGQGANLKLTILDKAEKSNIIATDFQVKYLVNEKSIRRSIFGSDRGDYTSQYRGSVPSEAIVQDGNLFTLQLGKLPIPQEYLQPGIKIDVEVIAKRSLGDNSMVKKLSKRATIKSVDAES
ncbi:hypothetical protein [Pleurocapsa sp. PCC 7319]|uniref:hypothetical protein n=1 Tax=Pleurocapsa sp. PCC 7319 TaxID=118161 RepID=UPI00035DFC09|nr:hypothetical protein [Pleurocapsa sp. PCC 7319]